MADLGVSLQRTVRTEAGGWRFTDEVYNARWISGVKRQIKVSETGCWLWQGFINPAWGYAFRLYRGKQAGIHRKMYELTHGVSLTREQYVCHSCDVRHCCNPDHLWLGTNGDNQRDSSRKARHYESRRTHCERGHEFAGDNLIVRTQGRGYGIRRVCKECERIRHRLDWQRNREHHNQRQREWRRRRKERMQREQRATP